MVGIPTRTILAIIFTNEDFKAPDPDQNDPMVILIELTDFCVEKTLVDKRISVNIIYGKTFWKLDIVE